MAYTAPSPLLNLTRCSRSRSENWLEENRQEEEEEEEEEKEEEEEEEEKGEEEEVLAVLLHQTSDIRNQNVLYLKASTQPVRVELEVGVVMG